MSCKIEGFIKEIKDFIKEVVSNYNIIELCSFLCSKYLFVDNQIEKENILDEVLNDVSREELCNLIKYILEMNIIIDEKEVIFNQWIMINDFLKRREYVLKNNNGYELIFLKDHEPIKITQLLK